MKNEEVNGFNIIKFIIVITIGMLFLTLIIFFCMTMTKSKKKDNYLKELDIIVDAAKNAHLYYEKKNSDLLASSDNNKALCVTVKGLISNEFIKDIKWEGYIVVEKIDEKYNYSLWLSNKEFMILGGDLDNASKQLEEYKNNKINENISSFKSVITNNSYNGQCVNGKV